MTERHDPSLIEPLEPQQPNLIPVGARVIVLLARFGPTNPGVLPLRGTVVRQPNWTDLRYGVRLDGADHDEITDWLEREVQLDMIGTIAAMEGP